MNKTPDKEGTIRSHHLNGSPIVAKPQRSLLGRKWLTALSVGFTYGSHIFLDVVGQGSLQHPPEVQTRLSSGPPALTNGSLSPTWYVYRKLGGDEHKIGEGCRRTRLRQS